MSDAFSNFSFALCSTTSECYDPLHGRCLFQRVPSILANCLYFEAVNDVRKCQTPACNDMSYEQRSEWRKAVRALYIRAMGCPCFVKLPFPFLINITTSSTITKVSDSPYVELLYKVKNSGSRCLHRILF